MTRGRPQWLGAQGQSRASSAEMRSPPSAVYVPPSPTCTARLSLRLDAPRPPCHDSPSALLFPSLLPMPPFVFIPSLPSAQKTQSFSCNSSSRQVFEATCFPPRKWSVGLVSVFPLDTGCRLRKLPHGTAGRGPPRHRTSRSSPLISGLLLPHSDAVLWATCPGSWPSEPRQDWDPGSEAA